MICTAAQYREDLTKTDLKVNSTHYKADDPIIVDVWVENQTNRDIDKSHFSPFSSSVGTPYFVIIRVPDGNPFSVHPGVYGDDWSQWYKPEEGSRGAFSTGRFTLPSSTRVHLLHGDLRLAILRAKEHCQKALDMKDSLERPDNSTNKHYQDIVRFANDFLKGGTFDIQACAYSKSEIVRIDIEKAGSITKP
jgi:hypothetical protein